MRKKRILPMLVAVMLLCAIAVSVAAVGLTGPAKVDDSAVAAFDKPKVTVVGNQVTNATGYFELSLQVSAKNFQSAGVVLTYDATVLTPVDWQKDGATIDLKDHTDWGTATVAYTKGLDGMSSKPALICKPDDSNTGWLYLGSDTLEYTNLLDERVVTVRFKIVDGKTVDFPGTTVQTATTDAILTDSATGATLQTSVGPGPVFYSSKEDPTYTVDFLQDDGPSIDKGGSSVVSGDYAITFFDWDGRVIDAVAAPQDAADAVDTWKAPHLQPGGRLNNKPGYEFDQWLVVYENNDGKGLQTLGGTFTSNDTALNANTNPDVAQLGDISGYTSKKDPTSKAVLLQAAYRARSADNGDTDPAEYINSGVAGAAAQYYTVEPIKYTRYGEATSDDGKYSITLEVKRLNSANKGVTRARTPGVVVMMQPTAAGSQPIFTLLSLENTDTVTCEMVPNKQISSVEYYFIDANTSPGNWPGAGKLSPPYTPISKDGDTGFVRLGTVGYINDMAREKATLAEFVTAMDSQTFADADLSYSAVGIATAQRRLYNAVRKSTTDLTRVQLQTAIGNSAND